MVSRRGITSLGGVLTLYEHMDTVLSWMTFEAFQSMKLQPQSNMGMTATVPVHLSQT
jgi:hypothetical protein